MKREVNTVGSGALLAAAAAAASSNSALAGDIGRPPDPVAAPTWQGFYVGGNVGVSWLNSSFDDTGVNGPLGYGGQGGTTTNANSPGWLGGLQAGYNWQDRNFVYGLEADISFLGNAKTSSAGMLSSTAHLGAFTYSYAATGTRSSRVNGLATFRARFGFDFDGTMPFVTAGLALADVKNTYTFSNYGSSTTSKTSALPGVAFGGGIEHQFTDSRWSVRAEVLWVGFQDRTLAVTALGGSYTAGNARFSDNLVIGRVGLNYRF